MEFKVGDKVIRNYNNKYGSYNSASIGTVIKITPKRKDVVVDYGTYKETYELNGWQKAGSIWTKSSITVLTPEIEKEIEKEIRDKKIIRKCRELLESVELNAEQARKILEIINA